MAVYDWEMVFLRQACVFVFCLTVALAGRMSIVADRGRADAAERVDLVRVPGNGLQPQAVVDRDGRVHVIYFGGEPAHGDVFYTRLDGDDRFSTPVRVNSEPATVVAIGNVRGARVALGSGRVHVAWVGSDRAAKAAEAAPMLYTRSRADGTFEPARNVHRNAGPIDGGSIGADDRGHVLVAWHSELPGRQGEAQRRTWIARSSDAGATFAGEFAASPDDAGACGCCGSSTFVDRAGTAYVLFRDAREKARREAMLLTSTDAGATFAAQVLQPWNIDACPMSTFALAEGGRATAAAWETAGQIYWSPIDRSTHHAGAPIAAPGASGRRKHPSIARNDRGETLVAWTEGMGWSRGGAVAWQLFDRNGAPAGAVGRAEGVPAWSLVSAFVRPDGRFAILY